MGVVVTVRALPAREVHGSPQVRLPPAHAGLRAGLGNTPQLKSHIGSAIMGARKRSDAYNPLSID